MVSIRKAAQDDIVQIKNVVTKAWHDTYKNIMTASTSVQFLEASFSTSRLEKRIKETLFLVAEVDGEIVGFANFIYGKALNLSAIYVLPEHQRHAIGRALCIMVCLISTRMMQSLLRLRWTMNVQRSFTIEKGSSLYVSMKKTFLVRKYYLVCLKKHYRECFHE